MIVPIYWPTNATIELYIWVNFDHLNLFLYLFLFLSSLSKTISSFVFFVFFVSFFYSRFFHPPFHCHSHPNSAHNLTPAGLWRLGKIYHSTCLQIPHLCCIHLRHRRFHDFPLCCWAAFWPPNSADKLGSISFFASCPALLRLF